MKYFAPPITPERLYLLDQRAMKWAADERELEQYLAARHAWEDYILGPYLAEARILLYEMDTTPAQYRERRLAYRLKKIREAQ